MKHTVRLALIILSVLPASAQKAASPNCSANRDTANMLAQDYAAQVSGLLREAHAGLQYISARMAAGQLTPEQGRELKLSATRDTISRLDTLAAVFDARLGAENNRGTRCGTADAEFSDASNTARTRRSSGTVSVEQLRREEIIALGARRTEESTR